MALDYMKQSLVEVRIAKACSSVVAPVEHEDLVAFLGMYDRLKASCAYLFDHADTSKLNKANLAVIEKQIGRTE